MPAPTKALEELEEANRLHKELYPGNYPEDDKKPEEEGNTEGKTAEPETGEGQAPEPAPGTEVKVEKGKEATEGKEPVTQVPTVETISADLAELQEQNKKLQQSYKVLQGKYNAEIKTDINALQAEIDTLRSENEMFRSQSGAHGSTTTSDAVKKELSGKVAEAVNRLKEDLGEEYVKDLTTVFEDMIGKAVGTIDAKVNTVLVDSTKSKSSQYVERLTELCPDWQTIKSDHGFVEFLEETDLGSGKTRYDLASEGMKRLNADRVAHWYNQYKESAGLSTKKTSAKTTTDNPPKKGKESLIAPTSAPRGAPRESDKKFYKASELQNFANDVARGRYKGKDAYIKQMQNEFDQAQHDGRILAGQ